MKCALGTTLTFIAGIASLEISHHLSQKFYQSQLSVLLSGGSLIFILMAPLVVPLDLLLLLVGEVLLDVEGPPDLLRRLALDHVGHALARHVQQQLDVKVVGGQDQLEKGALK